MEIEIITRNKEKRGFVHAVASVYSKELKIDSRKINLSVRLVNGLCKESGLRGGTVQLSKNDVEIALDSRLDLETMLTTLAHEMVHVKQYALGQLKVHGSKYSWLGKKYNVGYLESPWEIEAFRRERLIANKVWSILSK